MDDFIALKGIKAPGTSVFGYQRGDAVPAAVVDDWELSVGTNVALADVAPLNTLAVPRPDDDAPRSEWEAYAAGAGMSSEKIEEASLADLQAIPEPEPGEDGTPAIAEPLPNPVNPQRPEDDALKSEWVTYVVARGADPEWANAKTTKKTDLQAYDPGADALPAPDQGDPLAESATERANG